MPNPISKQVLDDEVIVIENEFEQIRQCLGMYIGVGETEGVMHLVNEVMTNSIDEAVNPEVIKAKFGDCIHFDFDEKTCRFTITDNGRGMPLDKMSDLVGRKHAGTKFRNITSANRYSGGQNGVGITVTAALSDMFQVQCWRSGWTKTVHMYGNQLVEDYALKADPDLHGTRTNFIPSKKYIGAFKITCTDVEDYLRRLSYILPERVTILYAGTDRKGKVTKKAYKAQGLSAAVEYFGQELLFQPIWLKVPEVVVNYEDGDKDPDFFKMEFAFSYDRSADVPIANSFCNYVATKDGGYHETAVQKCIADYFTKQAKELDPGHKYEVNQDDCRYGLVFVVNCDHSNPNFEGQHKSRVGQKDIVKYSRKPIMTALEEFFSTNNGLLRKICSYLHQIARGRLEMNKVKTKTQKATSFLDDSEMKVFRNISDRNYPGYKELILAEGDSALAAVDSARNVVNQAIMAVTGVVPNTFGMTTSQVIKSNTFETLIKVLGCGVDENFDINKLKWNAIVLLSDSDVDGSMITSLLLVFFVMHMPELIKRGMIYKVIPPLYLIDKKAMRRGYNGEEYLFDKKEISALFAKMVAENMKIGLVHPETISQHIKGHGDVEELNKSQALRFLMENDAYYDELDNLYRRSACIPDVLEYLCYFILISRQTSDPISTFKTMLTKKFPELEYDETLQSIHGSYQSQNISVIIDDIFMNMAERFFRLMRQLPAFHILYRGKKAAKDDDPQKDEFTLLSYGQFIRMCKGMFDIPIRQRYKGLGETETMLVFRSMVNPKTRRMVRITVDDINRAIETLRRLHSDEPQMREVRRKMLDEADITIADIDN